MHEENQFEDTYLEPVVEVDSAVVAPEDTVAAPTICGCCFC